MNLNGRFSTIAETEKSIVVGLIENITMENIEYSDILKIAGFYGISTAPDLFLSLIHICIHTILLLSDYLRNCSLYSSVIL